MKTRFGLLILFALTLALLNGCSLDKKYSYIETVRKHSLLGNDYSRKEKEAETISAPSDTSAYLEAYEKFCIALKVYGEMKAKYNYDTEPLSFKLLNSAGDDITNSVRIPNKEMRELEIMTSVMKMHSGIATPDTALDKSSKDGGLQTGAWTYSNDADKMGDTTHLAYTMASEPLMFDFPYSGGSYATLVIRKSPRHGIDVYLKVSEGQFMTSYDGNSARLRFDDEKPQRFSFNEASDGSSDVIFFNSEQTIVRKLKSAKRLVIEVEFYQNGLRQIEFNVANLAWRY